MLEIVEAGLLTTVQDGGRPAAVGLGVPAGGACDRWSLAVANALLGNEPDAAALEMTLAGATLRARADCVVAIAGAEMTGRLVDAGLPAPAGAAVVLRDGETLAFGVCREASGVRTYLAVGGGVDVPPVLGSRSTCLVGGFGGLDGRPLRAGDVIRPAGAAAATAATAATAAMAAIAAEWPGPASPRRGGGVQELRVVAGPHLDRLPEEALARLLETRWTVSGRGDRQAIRLGGAPLPTGGASLLSAGVVWGAVQLPPDGIPLVLLADHQTVGGYPVAAVVIRADLPLLGQLAAGDEVRFAAVDLATARRALDEQLASWSAAQRQLGTDANAGQFA